MEVPVFSAKFNHLKNKRIKIVKYLANYRLECDLNIGGISSEDDETDVELEENEDAEDEEDAEDIESDIFDYNDKKKLLIYDSFIILKNYSLELMLKF